MLWTSLKGEDFEDHHLKPIIQDCKSIMNEMKLWVNHTLREGNRCKLGVNQIEKLEVLFHQSSVVKLMLWGTRTSFPCGF